ncbi:hypothetical protein RHMOL_Rhmol10G0163000 [Rhododendron molle]|uniref:Uncharacterized protein n=1 Tax=Rhododendron molle TaxID=49168 RepID=A0ACC0M360_RHOML|nr:hypothetical protein RHMOL_Rhmol10G0163000 [Rhododendron molle]
MGNKFYTKFFQVREKVTALMLTKEAQKHGEDIIDYVKRFQDHIVDCTEAVKEKHKGPFYRQLVTHSGQSKRAIAIAMQCKLFVVISERSPNASGRSSAGDELDTDFEIWGGTQANFWRRVGCRFLRYGGLRASNWSMEH